MNQALNAQELIAGPRGRRLCLELAAAANGQLDAAFTRVSFAHDLHADNGVGLGVGFETGHPADDEQPGRRELREARAAALNAFLRQTPSVQELADQFAAAPLPHPTAGSLFAALFGAVSSARHWQEPDGTDALLAQPQFRDQLAAVAEEVALAEDAAWWTRACTTRDQWVVDKHLGQGELPQVDPASALAMWRGETIGEEARGGAGDWWCVPVRRMTLTSGRWPTGHGSEDTHPVPVGLILEEDEYSDERGALVYPAAPAATASVYEINSAEDWLALCAESSLTVTRSRAAAWGASTGLHDTEWIIPDFAAAARHHQSLHLTVAGYLSLAGRALEVPGVGHTTVAGWDPDTTLWLSPVEVAGEPNAHWRDNGEGSWTPMTGV